MTNRVLLEPNSFKVSKPGFDVQTAPRGGLLFDSDYAHGKIRMSGQFAIPYPSIDGSGMAGGSVVTVQFGKTFPRPPMVYLDANSVIREQWNGFGEWEEFYVEGQGWERETRVRVYNHAFEFTQWAQYWEDVGFGELVRYFVVEYPL